MQVYKTKGFSRDARREGLSDTDLCNAIAEMNAGTIHATLGGGLCKQRVATNGKGKSGGWRTMLCFRSEKRAFFLYVFPKNERDNIDKNEKKALKRLSKFYMSRDAAQIKEALEKGEIEELACNGTESRKSDPERST